MDDPITVERKFHNVEHGGPVTKTLEFNTESAQRAMSAIASSTGMSQAALFETMADHADRVIIEKSSQSTGHLDTWFADLPTEVSLDGARSDVATTLRDKYQPDEIVEAGGNSDTKFLLEWYTDSDEGANRGAPIYTGSGFWDLFKKGWAVCCIQESEDVSQVFIRPVTDAPNDTEKFVSFIKNTPAGQE